MFLLHAGKKIDDVYYTPAPPEGGWYTVLPLSVLPSVQDIIHHFTEEDNISATGSCSKIKK
jgi:hypothetical protein